MAIENELGGETMGKQEDQSTVRKSDLESIVQAVVLMKDDIKLTCNISKVSKDGSVVFSHLSKESMSQNSDQPPGNSAKVKAPRTLVLRR